MFKLKVVLHISETVVFFVTYAQSLAVVCPHVAKKENEPEMPHECSDFNWRQIDLYIITMFIKCHTEKKLTQSSFSLPP